MKQTCTVIGSPVGNITLLAQDAVLCGLYLEGQRHWPQDSDSWIRDDGSHFDSARLWLDKYFSGEVDARYPEYVFSKGTDFQKMIWRSLIGIPFGQTVSYGELAEHLGVPRAVRALGAAVGRNPFSIIVPCHRVVGGNGSLTGYAGGLNRKLWLLRHEGVELDLDIIRKNREIVSTT